MRVSAILLVSLAAGCGSASFTSGVVSPSSKGHAGSTSANSGAASAGKGGGSGGGADADANDAASKTGAGAVDGTSGQTPGAGGTTGSTGVTSLPGPSCPPVPQAILVLDFKSGWWSGDGGDFFQTAIAGINNPCVGSVSFEYHHMITGSNTMQLIPAPASASQSPTMSSTDPDQATLHADWSAYTQIWVLSGSSNDPEDLDVTSTFFDGIAAKIAAAKAPLFVASGNGNINHVNALLTLMNDGPRFATDLPQGPVVDATGTFTVLSTLSMGKDLQEHALFARGVQTIAEEVRTAGGFLGLGAVTMQSDYLDGTGTLDVVGVNAAGKPAIAVTADQAARRMVFDSGLQRFYVVRSQQPSDQTTTYLQNIIVYLATP